jgi:D-alanyl-D-alanine carboxypeptidase
MIQSVSRGAILAFALVFYASLAQAQQYAALVMDARSGKVIHAVNPDTRVHPASLTKMMTLYIVFDEIRRGRMSLDQKVTVSPHAASEPPSRLGLRAGQRIEVRYLIRAAAIKSANDAATALGEAVAGSEERFAARMNQYARAMGMTRTTFKNANGLTREGHMSTARDMAILGRRLVYDFPQYYNIFSRNSTSAGIATVRNTNRRLLDAYPGADGIKTGYTRAAGFNLVSSAHRGNQRVIVSLMGGKSSASRNAEVARLMDLGFSRMPRVARLNPPEPLSVAAAAAPAASASARGSTVVAVASVFTGRPRPRALADGSIAVARNNQSITAAIAEVNAELAAAQASRDLPGIRTPNGRPVPRPSAEAPAPVGVVGSASTFAVAEARSRPVEPDPELEAVQVASNGTGTTGGNAWGVQLGAFRSKGDAERQLLTTALRDVPELVGGLRRVEAAKVQGVTIYRAQFVGLSQADALGACEALARAQAACLPLAPGI